MFICVGSKAPLPPLLCKLCKLCSVEVLKCKHTPHVNYASACVNLFESTYSALSTTLHITVECHYRGTGAAAGHGRICLLPLPVHTTEYVISNI